MLVWSLMACADPRNDALEQQVAELQAAVSDLQGQLGGTNTRLTGVTKDLEARVADLDQRLGEIDRRAARSRTVGALTGRWSVHAAPLANHGCRSEPYVSDYTWDVGPPSQTGSLVITVGGATSFPTIAASVDQGVLTGVSVRDDGSVATVVVERVDDGLVGYRTFDPRGTDERCSMTWKLTATRVP